jgi:hypothetical protein
LKVEKIDQVFLSENFLDFFLSPWNYLKQLNIPVPSFSEFVRYEDKYFQPNMAVFCTWLLFLTSGQLGWVGDAISWGQQRLSWEKAKVY